LKETETVNSRGFRTPISVAISSNSALVGSKLGAYSATRPLN
jgi:hypothetical protein